MDELMAYCIDNTLVFTMEPFNLAGGFLIEITKFNRLVYKRFHREFNAILPKSILAELKNHAKF